MLVTPDGERTMNTYLGAAQNLSPADLDEKQIAAAGIIYLEGYLWDPPQAKDAFRKAAEIAHGAEPQGRADALGCVLRRPLSRRISQPDAHRAVDLVFANESELRSLYQTADFDSALAALRNDVKLAVVTRSEKGCVVVSRESERGGARPRRSTSSSMRPAPATCSPPGFMVGLARGKDYRTAARLGALAAAEVIQHLGARPETSLKALAQQNGLPI